MVSYRLNIVIAGTKTEAYGCNNRTQTVVLWSVFRGGLLSYTYDSAVAIIMSNVISVMVWRDEQMEVWLTSGISENIRMLVLQPWLDVGSENSMLHALLNTVSNP